MIRDAEDGKIDCIMTKSISRFARNTVECLQYVRKLKDIGVKQSAVLGMTAARCFQ